MDGGGERLEIEMGRYLFVRWCGDGSGGGGVGACAGVAAFARGNITWRRLRWKTAANSGTYMVVVSISLRRVLRLCVRATAVAAAVATAWRRRP